MVAEINRGSEQLKLDIEPIQRGLGETALRFAVDHNEAGQPEIFDTIQGEGRNIGRPVVFARLSGCNLQCSWCDTPYTWAFNQRLADKHDEGVAYNESEEMVRVQVGDAIDNINGYDIKRLVVTGGEPMLQQQGIVELARGLRQANEDYWVEIETNGTIAPRPELVRVVDQFNISPKLENSGNRESIRRKDEVLKQYVSTGKADFKFVLAGDEDLPEILDIVERTGMPHENVFLMPEGRTPEEVKEHQEKLVDLAKTHNFNVTTRLHVLIWGSLRGV